MNENIEKIKDPSVSDFLNIYPPLSTNVNTINDSKKFLIYFGQLKQKNQKSAENSKNEIFTSHPHPYPILLEKILKQQKNKKFSNTRYERCNKTFFAPFRFDSKITVIFFKSKYTKRLL